MLDRIDVDRAPHGFGTTGAFGPGTPRHVALQHQHDVGVGDALLGLIERMVERERLIEVPRAHWITGNPMSSQARRARGPFRGLRPPPATITGLRARISRSMSSLHRFGIGAAGAGFRARPQSEKRGLERSIDDLARQAEIDRAAWFALRDLQRAAPDQSRVVLIFEAVIRW